MKHFKDLLQNFLAFGLYQIAVQFVLMPNLAYLFSAEVYSRIVIFTTVTNIFCLITGDTFGVTELIISKTEALNIAIKDKLKFLTLFFLSGFIVAICLFFLFKFNSIIDLLILISILYGNILRYYFYIYFRKIKNYKALWLQNFGFLVGALSGVLILNLTASTCFLLPFILAELFSILFISNTLKNYTLNKSKNILEISKVKRKYRELASFSTINILIVQIDSLSTFIIFSPAIVAAYYAISMVSKMVLLIIGPINSWVTATFSGHKLTKSIVTKKNVLIMFGFTLICFLVITLISTFGIAILYPKYAVLAKQVVLPISLTVSIKIVYSLISSYVVANYNPKIVTLSRLVYFVVFSIVGLFGGYFFGIVFFSYGVAIAQILSFIVMIKKWNEALVGTK